VRRRSAAAEIGERLFTSFGMCVWESPSRVGMPDEVRGLSPLMASAGLPVATPAQRVSARHLHLLRRKAHRSGLEVWR
jgi:hypothetical protein